MVVNKGIHGRSYETSKAALVAFTRWPRGRRRLCPLAKRRSLWNAWLNGQSARLERLW